jgi:16S rRNA G966 N2-methylase RsmD
VGVQAEVRRQDAMRFLAACRGAFDLVLVDPPYDSAARLAGPLAERLPAVLAKNAVVVTESDKRRPLELPLPIARERVYGDVRIAIHRG